jgi:integrase
VFTSNGTGPLVNFSFAKRRAESAMGTSDWRIHDLRRTATTLMARLCIPPHIADKILNHQSGTISGVAAVYNRFEYLEERKAALNSLGRFIEKMIGRGDENVVTLRQQA